MSIDIVITPNTQQQGILLCRLRERSGRSFCTIYFVTSPSFKERSDVCPVFRQLFALTYREDASIV